MSYLSIKNVNKIYPNGVHAVIDFDLEINENDFIVILGPSGCGKSTMLRMICGLEGISSGDMILEGKKINALSPKDRDIAMVFQNYALYGHMTTYDNVGFSLLVRKKNRRTIHKSVMDAAGIVRITDKELKRKPGQLSGGQRQRIALARTIARNAKLYLMDEPLSNLDAKLRGSMRLEILKLYKEYNQTVVYVSHDQVEAMTMATRIVVMDKGIVQQVGAPMEVYERPNNLFVATFLGTPQMNLIKGGIADGVFFNEFFSITLAQFKNYTNEDVSLGIRSEYLSLANDDYDFIMKKDYTEFQGSKYLIHGFLGDSMITMTSKDMDEEEVNIRVKLNLDKVVLFDNKTTLAVRSNDI